MFSRADGGEFSSDILLLPMMLINWTARAAEFIINSV